MIKLARSRAKTAIPESLRGINRREKERALLRMWRDYLAAGGDGSPPWKSAWWKAGKTQIKKHTRGKCAYCESPTDVVAHGDVEHFRPKTKYWWLAYCFDNHLFACQICNQSYKSDNFPIGAAMMTGPQVASGLSDDALEAMLDTFAPDPYDTSVSFTLARLVAACKAENPGLPDPYNDDPEPYFKWEADPANKEVWLRPRTHSTKHTFIAHSCERFFGLNREELRRWRWTLAYKHLADLKAILEQVDSQNATARTVILTAIGNMTKADQPYAGMVRYFVHQEWALPV